MIPREIRKEIRQIEIRPNRIVTETLAGALNIKAGVLTAKYTKYAKREQEVFRFVLFVYFAWFAVHFHSTPINQ